MDVPWIIATFPGIAGSLLAGDYQFMLKVVANDQVSMCSKINMTVIEVTSSTASPTTTTTKVPAPDPNSGTSLSPALLLTILAAYILAM